MNALPTWVIELVDGLSRYDAEHPKLYAQFAGSSEWQQADCACGLLALVPAEVRMYAAGWRAGRDAVMADKTDGAQFAATATWCNEQISRAMDPLSRADLRINACHPKPEGEAS